MRDLLKFGSDLATDPLSWRVLLFKKRELLLNHDEFIHQAVEFRVRQSRIIEHIVLVIRFL